MQKNETTLDGIEPVVALGHFRNILDIPRPSGDEGKIDNYLKCWAAKNGYNTTQDNAGNMAIHIPATAGYEAAKCLCIQGHKDMVYSDTSQIPVPIDIEVVDDWLQTVGKKKTLGADNAVALILAMDAATTCAVHGPLVFLATSQEETGLDGALAFRPENHGMSKNTLLVNLDTPEFGKITMASAGWRYVYATWQPARESASAGNCWSLSLTGLAGGHSGDHVHLNRGNAIKLMGHLLKSLPEDSLLVEFNAGEAGNSIPSTATAVVWSRRIDQSHFDQIIEQVRSRLNRPEISLAITETWSDKPAYTTDSTKKFVDLLLTLPDGVVSMSAVVPDLPELSSTISMVKGVEGSNALLFTHLVRSADDREVLRMSSELKVSYERHGCSVELGEQGHGWKQSLNSPLVQAAIRAFEANGHQQTKLKGYHCAVEVGSLLGDPASPNFADAVSFGAQVEDEHAPTERLYLPSLVATRAVLHSLLQEVAEGRV